MKGEKGRKRERVDRGRKGGRRRGEGGEEEE